MCARCASRSPRRRSNIRCVDVSPWEPGNPVHAMSPLGKVPVLVLDDGTQLFDSRVIVEYIDTVSPVSRLIPEPNRQRIEVKRWEALADGICDATLAIVLERRRPAKQQNQDWIERQRQKIAAGVAELARELDGQGVVQRRGLFAGRHRHRLRAGLPRPALPRARLAARVPEPGAARRQAREAAVVPGNRAARRVTSARSGRVRRDSSGALSAAAVRLS